MTAPGSLWYTVPMETSVTIGLDELEAALDELEAEMPIMDGDDDLYGAEDRLLDAKARVAALLVIVRDIELAIED